MEGENGRLGADFFVESGGGDVGWRNFMRELHCNWQIFSVNEDPEDMKVIFVI